MNCKERILKFIGDSDMEYAPSKLKILDYSKETVRQSMYELFCEGKLDRKIKRHGNERFVYFIPKKHAYPGVESNAKKSSVSTGNLSRLQTTCDFMGISIEEVKNIIVEEYVSEEDMRSIIADLVADKHDLHEN